MNNIKKIKDKYILTCEDGSVFDCELWYEKKTDKWHVKLPKGNPSGRTYVRQSLVDSRIDKTYEFETKTTFRTGLSGGGWRNRLTEDEKTELAEYESHIERLKKTAMDRKPLTEAAKLKDQVKKLEEELKALRELKEKSKK